MAARFPFPGLLARLFSSQFFQQIVRRRVSFFKSGVRRRCQASDICLHPRLASATATLPQGRPAGLPVVTKRYRTDVHEAVFIAPQSAITYDQAAENSASRIHAQSREEKYAFIHHVCIVFPFRREGTRQ